MKFKASTTIIQVLRCITRGDIHSLNYINHNNYLLYFFPKEENNYKLIKDLLTGTLYLISSPYAA